MTTTPDLQKTKDRISKLLAVASNDASTPGEKANAMQMASALMRRYNLERDDIDDHNRPSANFVTIRLPTLWARMTPWESTLASFVASYVVKSAFVVVSSVGGTGRNRGNVGQAILCFTGSGDDAEIAAETYKQLRTALVSQGEKKYGTTVRGHGRSYAVGFVSGLFVAAREAEALEKVAAAEISRALIRTDMLKTASQNFFLQSIGSGRLVSSRRSIGGLRSGAYEEGKADGRAANTSQQRPRSGLLN